MATTCTQAKLNPNNLARISFPGFQKILDFLSVGGESSVSVSVNGDTDLEYKIIYRNLDATNDIWTRLNNDSGSNYGYQYILNSSGTISSARGAASFLLAPNPLNLCVRTILTPAGFIKTALFERVQYSSGTTLPVYLSSGDSWNSTANVTSLNFLMSSGNFTSGTRIIVFARRA